MLFLFNIVGNFKADYPSPLHEKLLKDVLEEGGLYQVAVE
jgi:hypothetical protein